MEMHEIRFPAIGKDKAWVVTCDGKVFAGFDTREEACDARDMYARPVITSKKAASSNTLHDWGVRKR